MANKNQPPPNGGGDGSFRTVMQKRAKRKMIGSSKALNLVKVAEYNEDERMKKRYWNYYHCNNIVQWDGTRTRSSYCKNRFCELCTAIRQAVLINHYRPVIEEWEEPFYLVLTIKSPMGIDLKKRITEIFKITKAIVRKHEKRAERGTGLKLVGFRSLECNYNTEKRTYHPHINLILETKEMGLIFMKEWRERWQAKHGKGFISKGAQRLQRVKKDPNKTIMELFKYVTKDLGGTKGKKNTKQIRYFALDTIYRAMEGRRTFAAFGIEKVAPPKYQQAKFNDDAIVEYLYQRAAFDYINEDGEPLTEYQPPQDLINILTRSKKGLSNSLKKLAKKDNHSDPKPP